jgi:sigma-B regulation protein RsbU (phosphoserine phosphatase)
MPNTILVVDDEPDLELLITQRFRKQIRDGSLNFLFAANGEEALAVLDRKRDMAVVLTDINMPVMDGLTLLGKLNERYPLLKSVIVSAYGDMANIRTALNRGAFDFITKPIDFQDLSLTLDKSLQEAIVRKQAAQDREGLIALRKELDVARRIQESIVPRRFPPFPHRQDVAVHASMVPARSVGGDFYDYFFIDDHRLVFSIGDVTGKGVPAALYMAVSRTLLRATATRGLRPHECLAAANQALFEDTDSAMFVTCFHGVLDTRTGVIEFSNAGHNPPYLLRADGRVEITEEAGGFMLGAFPGVSYDHATMHLAPGDTLVLFTDGVTEAAGPLEELYGEERLVGCLERLGEPTGPTHDVVASVLADVQAFAAGTPPADDTTILAITWAAQGSAAAA